MLLAPEIQCLTGKIQRGKTDLHFLFLARLPAIVAPAGAAQLTMRAMPFRLQEASVMAQNLTGVQKGQQMMQVTMPRRKESMHAKPHSLVGDIEVIS
ncbi:hypothetical protein HHJ39_00105 [Escherichia coli]|nr:hypothetical protein HHJ39_00105 [Escherichia coli]